MSPEMTILALVTLFYAFSWIPVLAAKSRTYGARWLVSKLSTEGLPPLSEMGQRAVRAHDSLKESYPPFAIAVLLLAFSGGFTQYTAQAALVFLIARLVHMPAYIMGVPWLRTLSWFLGFAATVYLLIMALVALV